MARSRRSHYGTHRQHFVSEVCHAMHLLLSRLKGESQRIKEPEPLIPHRALHPVLEGTPPHGGMAEVGQALLCHSIPAPLPVLSLDSERHRSVSGSGAPAPCVPAPHSSCISIFPRALMDEDGWGTVILGEITVSSRLYQPRVSPPPCVWLGL